MFVALVAAIAALTQHSAPTPACSWQVFTPPNPGPSYNVLDAVAVVAQNDVWAGGWVTNASGMGQVQFQHFDGHAWTSVSAPALRQPFVNGMAALRSDSVWAVGSQLGANNASVGLILHWNGTRWNVSSNPAQNGNAVLYSIASVGNREMWAAGDVDVSGNIEPLIEHFNGRSWVLDKAYVPPSQSILGAIAGTSVGNLWAGGYYDGGAKALIEHYVPSQHLWVQSPTSVGNDVGSMSARSASDVWAVGAPDGSSLFVERWNGKSWNQVQYSHGGRAALHEVNATAKTGWTWVGGQTYGSQEAAFVDRYRAGRWEATPVVQVGKNNTALFALQPVPGSNDVWTVGVYGNVSSEDYNLAERWTCPAGAE